MTYDVLIKPQTESTYRAAVLGWPDLSVVGDDEPTVLERIVQAIRAQLQQGKVVRIEVDEGVVAPPAAEHPPGCASSVCGKTTPPSMTW